MRCPRCGAKLRVDGTRTRDRYVLRYRVCTAPRCEYQTKTVEKLG